MRPPMVTRLGQQFIVEDRTMIMATRANAVNATLYPNLNFNFIRDVDRAPTVADLRGARRCQDRWRAHRNFYFA